jgi:hypothetical protein
LGRSATEKKMATLPLRSINMYFVTEKQGVVCEVADEFLNIMSVW